MDEIITQVSGYAASVFLIISFLLKDQKKLRAINLIGCVFFVIYGFRLNHAWPIIIPNAIIAFTQIYHLWIMPLKKEK
jgi:membrane protein YdbS with pleckstrin-like domain